MLDKLSAHAIATKLNADRSLAVRATLEGQRLMLECLKNEPSNRPRRRTHVPIRNGTVSLHAVEEALRAIDAHV